MSEKVVNNFNFKEWILSHQNNDYNITQENDDLIKLCTDYGVASIQFTEVEEGIIIVEFSIIAKKDDSVKFYLHFQLSDENHAKQLYDEMVETLLKLKDERTIQVLLSCSAGLTTAMFAENLNSTAEMLGLDYHFNAVSYMSIYKEAENYDAIMIAPQIGYMVNRLKISLPDKPVLQIPTAVFASYDALSALKFVQDEIQKFNNEKNKKEKIEQCSCQIDEKDRVLSIAIMPNKAQTRLYYRLYDKGHIVDSNLIIRPSTKFEDIYDIIDTQIARHQHINIIGIATPGIIEDSGKLLYVNKNYTNINIKKAIEEKYQITTYVNNNVNAAAIGFSLEHPEYNNILFHSQPFGYTIGGQGIVSNGELINGKNGIAGEVRFFLRRMQLSDELENLSWSKTGALEIVTKSILPALALFGPDVVAIRSPMTPDMNEVKKKLSSFIPDEFMPEFVYIEEASPYMLDGMMKICLTLNKKENPKE